MKKPSWHRHYDVHELGNYLSARFGEVELVELIAKHCNVSNGKLVTLDRAQVRARPADYDGTYLADPVLNALHDEFGEVINVHVWW